MIEYRLLPLLVAALLTVQGASHSNLRHVRQLQSRQYSLLTSEEIHSTLLEWQTQYPNLVRLKTSQDAYGLPAAGDSSDCTFDAVVGCLNYILTIQDYVVHPEGSSSSNQLPQVFWSGAVHGDERVGPTATMEAASLLLEAASCEATFEYNPTLHASCSSSLEAQGIDKRQRQWLARLVATRRIVIVPTANALGYYRNTREEGYFDVNRDFPFDYTDATQCMRTIGGRTLNEVFREHLFQMALTFHGGTELIGYEWGADSFRGVLSPDDEAQNVIASSLSNYGGGWNGVSDYSFGPMDRIIYTVTGGMEDWAYAGSWLPQNVVQCDPSTYGGYATEKTTYNNSVLRAFNVLIETSNDKTPSSSSLGTSLDVLSRTTSGNGHVSRNIRLSLLSADLVEPYLQITGVDGLSLSTDVLPLTEPKCNRLKAVAVPQTFSQVTVEWTVGGAFEIDSTSLYYGNWSSVSDVDCISHPPNAIDASLLQGSMLTSSTGTGYFSKFGVSPTTVSLSGDQPLGPVFQATVDLSTFALGDEVIVLAKAKVDQSWLQQPTDFAPQVLPQSHMVNARTNSSWFHENNGNIVQGRDEWYSAIPLTLIIGNTATLEDVSNTLGGDSTASETSAPTRASTEPSTSAPTDAVTGSPPPTTSPTTISVPPTIVQTTPVPETASPTMSTTMPDIQPVLVAPSTPSPVISTAVSTMSPSSGPTPQEMKADSTPLPSIPNISDTSGTLAMNLSLPAILIASAGICLL